VPASAETTDVGELDLPYLFARAVQWRNGDVDAERELSCALASSDRVTRTAAQALLCNAKRHVVRSEKASEGKSSWG
jgi:hypothetical protein